jgi:hypothetical protein
VISPWRISCEASLSDNRVRKNPIEQVKKSRFDFYRYAFSKDSPLITCRSQLALRKNPIAALKKKASEFYRHIFPRVCSLIARRNRFSRRKNCSNRGVTRLVVNRNYTNKNRCVVTTNHLLLPSQRRKAAVLLPIAQPNCDFLESNCNERAQGGGGSQSDAAAESAISMISHGNFIQNGAASRGGGAAKFGREIRRKCDYLSSI